MNLKMLASSSVVSATLCGALIAQETRPGQATQSPQTKATQGVGDQNTSRQGTQSSATEQHIAQCLALDNQEEVILAKFAQEKSKNEEVTQFAKMLADEHQAVLKKLSKHAPEASREGYLTGGRTEQANPRSDANRTPGSPRSNTTGERDPNSAATAGQTPGARNPNDGARNPNALIAIPISLTGQVLRKTQMGA